MAAGATLESLPATLAPYAAQIARAEAVEGDAGATVLRLDGDAPQFLKIGAGDSAADVVDEFARLSWLAGRVPCPAVHAFGFEQGSAWLLAAEVPGVVAGAWLAREPGRLEEVVGGVARFMRRLHALPVDECPFDASVTHWLAVARWRVANGLVDEGDFDADHLGHSAAEVLAIVERLATSADRDVVVHGDFTLGNILLDAAGEVTGCIDVGRLGRGDRYQDIALMWRDLGGFGEAAQAAFLLALGLQAPDERRMLLHRALDELF